jgi:hypothetical protein
MQRSECESNCVAWRDGNNDIRFAKNLEIWGDEFFSHSNAGAKLHFLSGIESSGNRGHRTVGQNEIRVQEDQSFAALSDGRLSAADKGQGQRYGSYGPRYEIVDLNQPEPADFSKVQNRPVILNLVEVFLGR